MYQCCKSKFICNWVAFAVWRVTSARMPKGNRSIVYLVSTAGTGHHYVTTRNRRSAQDKLKLRKYDPKAKKHVVYEERAKL